ncbi:MAG: hypothetical protein ACUZ77_04665 [Candidatus Brocadiales bacterium]
MIGWSPEIIAGRIKKDHPGLSISPRHVAMACTRLSTSISTILRHRSVMN